VTVRKTEAGTSWSELARLDPLAAVLDPGDTIGAKNRVIDRIHKRALSGVAGDLRGRAVLDFGCGTGRLTEWLVDRGAFVHGVDVTPEMLDVARSRVAGATFAHSPGQALPFADATFDCVVTAYVLQYYVSDPAVFRELARVLKPGGRLLAIEQTTENEIGRGAPAGVYADAMKQAGFHAVEIVTIRLGDSRLIGLVQRHPRLARLPGLPRLAQLEARRLADLPLTGGRYADSLFVCVL
jgi:SAM-dependent methyltransferase